MTAVPLTFIGHLDDLLATLRDVLAKLFAAAKSPSVAACLIETLNDTLERSIAAQAEGTLHLG
jgi:hypothetical protein